MFIQETALDYQLELFAHCEQQHAIFPTRMAIGDYRDQSYCVAREYLNSFSYGESGLNFRLPHDMRFVSVKCGGLMQLNLQRKCSAHVYSPSEFPLVWLEVATFESYTEAGDWLAAHDLI